MKSEHTEDKDFALTPKSEGNQTRGTTGKSRLIDLGSVEVETRGSAGGTPDSPSPGHD